MTKLSIISKAEARRLLTDPDYRVERFGPGHEELNTSWDGEREWLERIAGGWSPCSCPRRHKGYCCDRACAEKGTQDCPPGRCWKPEICGPLRDQEALW